MTDKSSQTTNSKKIRVITQILTKAIKLWLKTQLTQVSQIEIKIGSSDRQLLSGNIPSVSIFATNAVYQGIHVTRINLLAENIHINLGSVLKGQPLRLSHVVPVVGEIIVEEQDLNNSLSSELLSTALNDVLLKLISESQEQSKPITWQEITIDNQHLIVYGFLPDETESKSVEMKAGLQLLNPQKLQLAPIYIKNNQAVILENNTGYNLDLGSDVALEEISLKSQQLLCRGRINVNP